MKRRLLVIGATVALAIGAITPAAAAEGPPCTNYPIPQAVQNLDLYGRDLADYILKGLTECGTL